MSDTPKSPNRVGTFKISVSTINLVQILKRELSKATEDQLFEIAALFDLDLTETEKVVDNVRYWDLYVTASKGK